MSRKQGCPLTKDGLFYTNSNYLFATLDGLEPPT